MTLHDSDPDGTRLPLFVASYRRTGARTAILRSHRTYQEHAIVDTELFLDVLEAVLLRCDGFTSAAELLNGVSNTHAGQLRDALDAFTRLGVLVDARSCQDYAATLLTQVLPWDPARAGRAYALERWTDDRFTEPTHVAPSQDHVSRRVGSTTIGDLDAAREAGGGVTPSMHTLVGLLQGAYGMVGSERVVPSAGAMWPLSFHALVPDSGGSTMKIWWFDDAAETLNTGSRHAVHLDEVHSCFVSTEFIDAAFAMRASLIIISADLRRAGLKYGTRAMQYALIETGAVMQRCYEHAAGAGVHVRAVGGFRQARLQRVVGLSELTPTLTIVVSKHAST